MPFHQVGKLVVDTLPGVYVALNACGPCGIPLEGMAKRPLNVVEMVASWVFGTSFVTG